MNTEKVAIIDLGTNTFHLLIASLGERDDFTILGKFKEAVKLGEGGINSGRIAPAAFERGVEALQNFRKLIDSSGATRVFAFATSAIRSAANGNDFIRKVSETSDINIRVINGNIEASYIHEGVINGVHIPPHENALLVDIGGGSVEFSISNDRQTLLLRSLNLGAARLLETINPSDPVTEEELSLLNKWLDKRLKELISELKEFDLSLMVGSSGTFETLATVIAYRSGDRLSAENLNGYRFTPQHFFDLFGELKKTTREERLNMQGMDAMRVDMIIMGGIILEYLLLKLPVQEIVVSSNALKEGILFRHILEKQQRVEKFIGSVDKSLRAKSVQNLAVKYRYDQRHGLKVSELATSLFDQLTPLHRLGPDEREILQYASVLHDIGRFVHPSGHHKHGQYIIMNSNLRGFSTNELVLLANLVRYHRKSLPKRDHYHFKILPKHAQKMVRYLGGILRIADNLDRGHRGLIDQVRVEIEEAEIQIIVVSSQDVSMEIEHATALKDMMEDSFGRTVIIRQRD